MERRKFLSSAALLAMAPLTGVKANDYSNNFIIPTTHDDEQLWSVLRSNFPLKNSRIYLNNGTMGLTPYAVLETLQQGFTSIAETGNYPAHTPNLQNAIGKLTGVDGKNIGITKNVSEGTNHACWSIAMKKGDEVLMTRHEHVGGALPWINRARLEGIVIKTFEPAATAEETLFNLSKAITKKTRVIAVPHIPCTIGQVFPVKEICDIARRKGIISCIDGAHPLGMIQFNLKEMGCDYYYGCVHKWALGPVGVGFFYIHPDMDARSRTTHVAAYSSDDFSMSAVPQVMGKLVEGAQRYSYGTFCGPLHSAATKALEIYSEIGPEKIEKRGKALSGNLQEQLLEFGSAIEMLTPTEEKSRACQIGFRIKNKTKDANQEFVSRCREKNIILRYVGESGIDCVRVSTHYYNTYDEISQLVSELKTYLG